MNNMEEHETGLELKRVRNPLFFRNKLPCEQSPLVILLGTARRSERDSAELVYKFI
jgi:hypothetical protein